MPRKSFVAAAVSAAVSIGMLVLPSVSGASPAGTSSSWHIGYYTPSNLALSMAQALPGSDGTLAVAPFTTLENTALLLNQQGSSGFLGDDHGKTVTATFTIAGADSSDFLAYPDGDYPGGTAPNVRLFFETSNVGGFNPTHYWWADAAYSILGNGTVTLTATLDTNSPWSDYYGKWNTNSAYTASFDAAARHITAIGLSFGGYGYFENGVGTIDGHGTLTLSSFSVS